MNIFYIMNESMNMNVIDLVGRNVKFLILGQYQESLTPELYIRGKLIGVDQSVYIIETENTDQSKKQIICVPMMQCVISTTDWSDLKYDWKASRQVLLHIYPIIPSIVNELDNIVYSKKNKHFYPVCLLLWSDFSTLHNKWSFHLLEICWNYCHIGYCIANGIPVQENFESQRPDEIQGHENNSVKLYD